MSIVKKGDFKTGDLAAYIPEASIVPDDLLEEMGLTGKLAGSKHNRVKAIRLRGVLSQGICYPAALNWTQGQDVAEELGIVKYEPPIPVHIMQGQVYNAGVELATKYDIENIKRYPDVLVEGEEVVVTEKTHGTFMCLIVVPERMADDRHYQDRFAVCSKGLGSQGLMFRHNEAK